MTTNTAQNNINAFSSDKFRILLSNVPTVQDSIHNLPFLYENFTQKIGIPSVSLEFIQSKFFGSSINHPISQKNDQLLSFDWTLKLDENLINYWNLFEYVQQIKFGQPNKSGPIRKYDIAEFQVLILDNQRIHKKTISYQNCFIEELSNLDLVQGISEEVFFTVTMKYELCILKDPPT